MIDNTVGTIEVAVLAAHALFLADFGLDHVFLLFGLFGTRDSIFCYRARRAQEVAEAAFLAFVLQYLKMLFDDADNRLIDALLGAKAALFALVGDFVHKCYNAPTAHLNR